jgi:hypothetical protein
MKRRRYREPGVVKQERLLKANWEDLLNTYDNLPKFSREPMTKAIKPNTQSSIPNYEIPNRNPEINFVKRTHTGPSCTGPSVEKQRYSGELAERESKALEEIERKKKRVGIAYNKGNYVYISDGFDPKDLGKK